MLGGGEHSYFDLICNLANNWHVISALPENGELLKKLKKKEIYTCIISMPPIRPWLLTDIIICLKNYQQICKAYNPHLIYANGSRAAVYAGIIGKLLNIPVIWHCRIANPDILLDYLLTKLCAKIIVNSNATARRFKSKSSQKFKVIYNGIDIAWFREINKNKNTFVDSEWKVILMVARISKWKRHDLALYCFERIAHLDEKVHIFFVGNKDRNEPDWWKYLQKMTSLSRYSDRIHWIGHVEDVRLWYRDADLLLLPSKNEPFGRVLVEAMACGVPIVATMGGGVPEIIRHGKDGYLVQQGKKKELAEAVEKLLKNNDIRLRMGRSGKERAEDFTIQSHIRAMTEVFEETIKI
jgi:glycosyltransferase involved in cell wall biosynthesis